MAPASQITPNGGPSSGPASAPQRIRSKRRTTLGRDIAIVLAVKAILLGLIWYAFFRAPAAPHMNMDPSRVEQKVLGRAADPESPHAQR
jgi:hypothetical protein